MINNSRQFAALLTDSYKYSHFRQYPKGTSTVYSYLESRGGEFDEIVVFGHTYYIKEFLTGEVIDPVFLNMRVKPTLKSHFTGKDIFNERGFIRLRSKHGGKLPIKIYALPEGTVIPTRTPQLAIENTDPEFPWLTNFLETLLSLIWYPSTVASNSLRIRKLVKKYLLETTDLEGEAFDTALNTRVHDFGMRGVSSFETGQLGSLAHLLTSWGTDASSALFLAQDLYGLDNDDSVGFSIPASEHSTITSWSREGEIDAFRNMLSQFPTGFVACVSDSFDIRDAVSNKWGLELKNMILERDGTLVIRPDSGHPKTSVINILNILWDRFGGNVNSKGFKVLDPHIRIIQGDGIDFYTIGDILQAVKEQGFSAENLAFGSGGGLLQKFNRDTAKYAFKCSEVVVNGVARDVRKSPMEWNSKGDYVQSFKHSKSGRFKDLQLIFENGNWVGPDDSFETIRQRVMSH